MVVMAVVVSNISNDSSRCNDNSIAMALLEVVVETAVT